jgi:hypothetical protein
MNLGDDQIRHARCIVQTVGSVGQVAGLAQRVSEIIRVILHDRPPPGPGRQGIAERRIRLQAGGDINGISENLLSVEYHVPQMDADAQLNPAMKGDVLLIPARAR